MNGSNIRCMEGYSTLLVAERGAVVSVTINRPKAKNSINNVLIKELLSAFTQAEKNTNIKVVILEGNEQHFCTGMDFNALSKEGVSSIVGNDSNDYYKLLALMASCSKLVIAKVDGKANAGGIGLIAASDIVIARDDATFSLSEVLFGLLPACVMPFLIRRVGFQKAKWMTLTTQNISCQRAYQIGLVDEQGANTDDLLRRNLIRLTRLDTQTIMDLKAYMSKLWIIHDETQKLAVDKITTLLHSERVQCNITNFVEHNKFPWQ